MFTYEALGEVGVFTAGGWGIYTKMLIQCFTAYSFSRLIPSRASRRYVPAGI